MNTLNYVLEQKRNIGFYKKSYTSMPKLFTKYKKRLISNLTEDMPGMKIRYYKNLVIFNTTDKETFCNDLYVECNGLIIDIYSNKLVSVPRQNILTANERFEDNLFDKYVTNDSKISYVKDGTIFTVYFYKNKWDISTCNGINMYHVMNNGKKYHQLLDETLQTLFNIDLHSFLSLLNESTSYTFGFKHPQVHRFQDKISNKYDFWYVSEYNKKTNKRYNDPNETLSDILNSNDTTFSFMTKSFDLKDKKVLRNQLFQSMNDLELDNTLPNFGFICNTEFGDILFTTELYKFIQFNLYTVGYVNDQINNQLLMETKFNISDIDSKIATKIYNYHKTLKKNNEINENYIEYFRKYSKYYFPTIFNYYSLKVKLET